MAIRADDVDLDRDQALVQRFQAGDFSAFDELYIRYHDRLERFCLRRVGDRHAAEEVAQEAFVRALNALPALEGERRFYPWVSVIASRLCIDHHRRESRTEPVPDIDPGSVPGAHDAVVEAVDADLVNQAMGRLHPRHRDVLYRREVDGLSYRQIADHYKVGIGSIETLLFRARRSLRKEFRIVDGTGLVAVPFVAWLVHAIAKARDRLQPWASLNTAPSTIASAATATAAAVVIAVAPGSWAPHAIHEMPPSAGGPAAAHAGPALPGPDRASRSVAAAGSPSRSAAGAPARAAGAANPSFTGAAGPPVGTDSPDTGVPAHAGITGAAASDASTTGTIGASGTAATSGGSGASGTAPTSGPSYTSGQGPAPPDTQASPVTDPPAIISGAPLGSVPQGVIPSPSSLTDLLNPASALPSSLVPAPPAGPPVAPDLTTSSPPAAPDASTSAFPAPLDPLLGIQPE